MIFGFFTFTSSSSVFFFDLCPLLPQDLSRGKSPCKNKAEVVEHEKKAAPARFVAGCCFCCRFLPNRCGPSVMQPPATADVDDDLFTAPMAQRLKSYMCFRSLPLRLSLIPILSSLFASLSLFSEKNTHDKVYVSYFRQMLSHTFDTIENSTATRRAWMK